MKRSTKATRGTTVVGVFADRTHAQQAVNELKRMGFREDQIGVVSREADRGGTGDEPSADRATNSKVAEGSAIGAATGAGAGALWALGIAAGLLPGVGWVVGGTLMAVLASAGGLATLGTIVGGLVGLGIPEEDAHYYEGEVKAGRTLVTVHADRNLDEVRAVFQRFGGYDRSNAVVADGVRTDRDEDQTMQLKEERLRVSKTPVEKGHVRVRKEVVTEQQNIQVPVQREEVVIERHPASGRATNPDLQPGEEIRIPVKEERVHVGKETVVREEVSVGKRKITDNEHVSDTVRKEQVRVDRQGDVEVKEEGRKTTRK